MVIQVLWDHSALVTACVEKLTGATVKVAVTMSENVEEVVDVVCRGTEDVPVGIVEGLEVEELEVSGGSTVDEDLEVDRLDDVAVAFDEEEDVPSRTMKDDVLELEELEEPLEAAADT